MAVCYHHSSTHCTQMNVYLTQILWKIYEFPDDTTGVGFITDGEESAYRCEVDAFMVVEVLFCLQFQNWNSTGGMEHNLLRFLFFFFFWSSTCTTLIIDTFIMRWFVLYVNCVPAFHVYFPQVLLIWQKSIFILNNLNQSRYWLNRNQQTQAGKAQDGI